MSVTVLLYVCVYVHDLTANMLSVESFNVCVSVSYFYQQRSLRVKWTIASTFKEDKNFIMCYETHAGKYESSKAHKQPTLAFPVFHSFLSACTESKRSNILKTCQLTPMRTRK